MDKITVCVIFGGESSEYGVSLKSAYTVLKKIDYKKYNVIRLGITRKGKWYIFKGSNEEIVKDTWLFGNVCPVSLDINRGAFVCENGERIYIDLVFPVLHGKGGEDGRLQGLLDLAGIKYVGCGAYSSHTGIDKHLSKLIAFECGAEIAPYTVINKNEKISFERIKKWADDVGYPIYVKDTYGGSSVGVYRAENPKELALAIDILVSGCDKILIEKGISGRETEIAVMEIKGEITVSQCGEISYKTDFYDYDAKYNSTDIEYIIPAKISADTEKRARELAKKIFISLGCSHLCRVDFFVTDMGEIIFNEVNTLPGFTEISMFPKLFLAHGFSFTQIIDYLIDNVLKKY